MLASQKLQLEMSDARRKINAMSAQEEFEIDALDGLNKGYLALETRYASAIISEAAEQDATATDDLGRSRQGNSRDLKSALLFLTT